MDALARSIGKLFLLVVSPLLATTAATSCLAGGHDCHYWQFPFVNHQTHCAWHRTWHGPYALAKPLRPYYIPRTYAYACWGGYNCEGYADDCYGEGEEYPSDCYSAGCVVEPPGMEHLGQIPNEIALSVGVAGPGSNR